MPKKRRDNKAVIRVWMGPEEPEAILTPVPPRNQDRTLIEEAAS